MQFLKLLEFLANFKRNFSDAAKGDDPRFKFDCGVPALNEYLQKQARLNDEKKINVTWILANKDCSQALGYFTLCSASISREQLPLKGLPRYPVPAQMIGRLAVDLTMRGRGLGELLLMKAFFLIQELAKLSGVTVVLVDAKDTSAKYFYEKYGFKSLPDREGVFPSPMFMAVADLEKLREILQNQEQ